MKHILIVIAFVAFVCIITNSCKTTNCGCGNEQKMLNIEYQIIDGSDCGLSGIIKNGEFLLQINGDRHESILLNNIKSHNGAKDLIKTNFVFKSNENIYLTLLDENQANIIYESVQSLLEGYYKTVGTAMEIVKNAPGINKLLDKYQECGSANFFVGDEFMVNNYKKEIFINDSKAKNKVKLTLYFTCR